MAMLETQDLTAPDIQIATAICDAWRAFSNESHMRLEAVEPPYSPYLYTIKILTLHTPFDKVCARLLRDASERHLVTIYVRRPTEVESALISKNAHSVLDETPPAFVLYVCLQRKFTRSPTVSDSFIDKFDYLLKFTDEAIYQSYSQYLQYCEQLKLCQQDDSDSAKRNGVIDKIFNIVGDSGTTSLQPTLSPTVIYKSHQWLEQNTQNFTKSIENMTTETQERFLKLYREICNYIPHAVRAEFQEKGNSVNSGLAFACDIEDASPGYRNIQSTGTHSTSSEATDENMCLTVDGFQWINLACVGKLYNENNSRYHSYFIIPTDIRVQRKFLGLVTLSTNTISTLSLKIYLVTASDRKRRQQKRKLKHDAYDSQSNSASTRRKHTSTAALEMPVSNGMRRNVESLSSEDDRPNKTNTVFTSSQRNVPDASIIETWCGKSQS